MIGKRLGDYVRKGRSNNAIIVFCVILVSSSGWNLGCHRASSELGENVVNSEQTRDVIINKEVAVTENVRPAVLAGKWYESNADKLRSNIENWLGDSPVSAEKVQAIVVPHAGHVWSGDVAGQGWAAARGQHIKRVFVLCPNHRVPVDGVVADEHDAFDTPLGAAIVDVAARDALIQTGLVRMNARAHAQEHAIEIQLPFMKVVAPDATLVPLIVGQLSDKMAQKFAAELRKMLTEDDLLVISSDFIHYGESYGYVPFTDDVEANLAKADAQTVAAIGWVNGARFADFAAKNDHVACGINALRVMAWLFEGTGAQTRRLAYGTSGAKTGSFDMSVSYVAMSLFGVDFAKMRDGAASLVKAANADHGPVVVLDELGQAKANALIRMAVAQAVAAGHETPFVPSAIVEQLGVFPKIFEQQFGVFVTLHKHGQLRGCIGNILPYQNLMLSLWGRAQDAALNDPRFDPVTPDELKDITYEISILTPPEPIAGPQDIVIGRHGVVMKKLGHSAVFLPQVAPEQGWNVEQMLTALSLKAGLRRDDWQSGASFSVIEAQVF